MSFLTATRCHSRELVSIARDDDLGVDQAPHIQDRAPARGIALAVLVAGGAAA